MWAERGERAASWRRSRSGGSVEQWGPVSNSTTPDSDWSCGRQVVMYLGGLEPKHWGTSLSASKWQRSS